MLIKKSFKSLDFYEVYRFTNSVTGIKLIKKPDCLYHSDPIEKIQFPVESPANFTFQKLDENENINEKVKSLEKGLNNLESRLDKLEKK